MASKHRCVVNIKRRAYRAAYAAPLNGAAISICDPANSAVNENVFAERREPPGPTKPLDVHDELVC